MMQPVGPDSMPMRTPFTCRLPAEIQHSWDYTTPMAKPADLRAGLRPRSRPACQISDRLPASATSMALTMTLNCTRVGNGAFQLVEGEVWNQRGPDISSARTVELTSESSPSALKSVATHLGSERTAISEKQ